MKRRSLHSLAREAFHAAGEKRYPLARLAYPLLLGPDWRYALLAWGYIKTLDDLVDEEASAQQSLDVLKLQAELIERIYAGLPPRSQLSRTEVFGEAFFRWDRSHGARLRTPLEAVLRSMEYDIRRRGCPEPFAGIDAYLVEMGGALFDLLVHFAVPRLDLPSGLRESACRAYLYADTLMDLEHDLAFGLVNVPLEDLDAWGIDPDTPDASTLRRWVADRAPAVEAQFELAFARLRRLPRVPGAWGRLLLGQKRRRFRHFLADRGLSYLVSSGSA